MQRNTGQGRSLTSHLTPRFSQQVLRWVLARSLHCGCSLWNNSDLCLQWSSPFLTMTLLPQKEILLFVTWWQIPRPSTCVMVVWCICSNQIMCRNGCPLLYRMPYAYMFGIMFFNLTPHDEPFHLRFVPRLPAVQSIASRCGDLWHDHSWILATFPGVAGWHGATGKDGLHIPWI